MAFDFAFEDLGQPNGPALVMVHGLLSNRLHWQLNLPALDKTYRIILVDLPAHGQSPAPAHVMETTPDRMVDALERLRVKLDIDKWYLCAQSVGAAVTLRYALTYPDRVIAQIFTNGNALVRPFLTDDQLETHNARLAKLRNPEGRGIREEAIHPRLAKRFPEAIRAQLVEAADRMDPAAFADFLDDVMPNISLRRLLPRMQVPTCLINGRHEHRFQPLRDWIAANCPAIQIVDIDGGHSVNIENAPGFDAATLDFLGCHRAG